MIRDYKDFKPVKAGGQIFIFFGLFFLFTRFVIFRESYTDPIFDLFAWANVLWYLLMGVGILHQKIWGYYMLKIWLHVACLCIPIGTYIGIKSLRYIEDRNIKEFFAGKSLEL